MFRTSIFSNKLTSIFSNKLTSIFSNKQNSQNTGNSPLLRSATAALFAVFLVLGLSACQEGEAEQAGEKIDEMVSETGNKVEDLCEDVKEGVKAQDQDC